MIRSSRSRWLSGIGAVVLIGGLVLANFGSGVTPAEAADWKKNLPSANRFTTAFPGAVLDKNTGLVWEQAPDITGGPNANGTKIWIEAIYDCVNKNVGGTRGWRLPSVAELASLIDPSLPPPFVPDTVFTGVQTAVYWSASTGADNPAGAWFVFFNNGVVGINNKDGSNLGWCVRGPMNADAY